MADRIEDAQLGLICQAAYFTQGPITSPPAAIPIPANWKIVGYLSAQDSLIHADGLGERVYYGFLAESKDKLGNFIVAIRGTIDLMEWGENGQCLMQSCALGGMVERGFYDIYETLQLDGIPADAAIFSRVGTAGQLTIVGHSLGAAIATYLTLAMAKIPGMRVRARYFASPHPGDLAYASAFDMSVADYVSYAHELDVVPHLPIGFGYTHLPKTAFLAAKNLPLRIKLDLGCFHSLVSYIALLDPMMLPLAIKLNPSAAACVIVPSVSAAAQAAAV